MPKFEMQMIQRFALFSVGSYVKNPDGRNRKDQPELFLMMSEIATAGGLTGRVFSIVHPRALVFLSTTRFLMSNIPAPVIYR